MGKKSRLALLIIGAVIFFLGYFLIKSGTVKMAVCLVGIVISCYELYMLISGGKDSENDNQELEDNGENEPAMSDEELAEFLTKDGEYDYESSEDIFCDDCGAVRKPGWFFCPECGYCYDPPEIYCKNCGDKISDSWSFCVKCGYRTEFEAEELSEDKTEYEGLDSERPCPRCNHFYIPDWNFCATCGLDFKANNKHCPSCSTPASEGWDYCAVCGHRINEE